jgi:hypothetical protein
VYSVLGSDLMKVRYMITPLVDESSALGLHGIIASGVSRSDALKRRFCLQSNARSLLPDMPVARCLRIQLRSLVEIWHQPVYMSASFGGLQTCGSVHVCPCCGAKIAARRADEIMRAAKQWIDTGGSIMFSTFTLQHQHGESLADTAGALKNSYRFIHAGRSWQSFAADYGVIGSIAATEYTYGKNGWHPHLHVLLFVATEISRDMFHARLSTMWLHALHRFNRNATDEYGVMTKACTDVAGLTLYTTKVGAWTIGDELARAGRKRARHGRSIVQLLADSTTDAKSANLFCEYARWTYRKNALVWSRGLRNRLLGDEPEKSDEEIAAEHITDGQLLLALWRSQWRIVLANDIRADLLAVAANGNLQQVVDFLLQFGITVDVDVADRLRAAGASSATEPSWSE